MADEDYPCDGYPEHDYEIVGERDGWVTYRCRRCDAETWSQAEADRAMSGRAIAIAQLICMHGPMRAVEILKEANAEHRRLHPNGCEKPSCPVCHPMPHDHGGPHA